MKRIKAMNGYTIYEVTARDEKQGNGTAGEFAIYFSSDIRDYGREYSYAEYEGIGSLEEAEAICTGRDAVNYAKARELCEQESTAVSFEDIEQKLKEIEAEQEAPATLYLESRGGDIRNPETDLTNYRLSAVGRIPCKVDGEILDMYIEFHHWERYTYRRTNKRTGAPLKHPVKELVNRQGLWIDTEYETIEERNGVVWHPAFRCSTMEKETHDTNPSFTRADVLEVLNRYSIRRYNKVVVIDEEVKRIVNRLGGFREKDILATDSVVRIGDTWNDDHKVVRVTARRDNKLAESFEVDLATGRICG